MSGQQHAPAALYPKERPGTHFTEGWMGPRAGLDRRKISSPPGFDPGPSSPQSFAIPTELPGPRERARVYRDRERDREREREREKLKFHSFKHLSYIKQNGHFDVVMPRNVLITNLVCLIFLNIGSERFTCLYAMSSAIANCSCDL